MIPFVDCVVVVECKAIVIIVVITIMRYIRNMRVIFWRKMESKEKELIVRDGFGSEKISSRYFQLKISAEEKVLKER